MEEIEDSSAMLAMQLRCIKKRCTGNVNRENL